MREKRYGNVFVPVLKRDWREAPKQPYHKTYSLKLGQSWFDVATSNQREYYVIDEKDRFIPAGAMEARELKREGAKEAAFVEIWGRKVVVNENLVCVGVMDGVGEFASSHVETKNILSRFFDEQRSYKGFPDVIAVFPDGRIVLREIKRTGKDQVTTGQHEAADLLREILGKSVQLSIVEW